MKSLAPYLAVLAGSVVACLAWLGIATANAQESPTVEPSLKLVSIPDFINADVGDVTGIRRRGYLGWDRGDPNSINDHYRDTLGVVLKQVKSENPDAVLVAGDEVMGEWGQDVGHTGIFGPVDTYKQKLQAIRNAGGLYYPKWKQRFTGRGLRVYPAVGDHEIGDDPWPRDSFKNHAFGTFKGTWARHFTAGGTKYAMRPRGTPFAGTAYAVKLSPKTLLITVDEFAKYNGTVHIRLTDGQLDWVRRTIEQARANGVKNVIVQGHVSVLRPVNYWGSSNLLYEGGRSSRFWQMLKRHHVDLYLAGEAHDMTVHTDGTLVQVTHGGYVPAGRSNYLVIKVYEDRIELVLKKFSGHVLNNTRKLWQTSRQRPAWNQVIYPGPRSVGTMTIDKSTVSPVLRDRTGKFAQ
jgi:hypothetical protein